MLSPSSQRSANVMRAIVRFTYEAEDGNQLSLRQVGDIIIIHSQDSEDWWDGEFQGERGYLPAKYVELLPNIPDYAQTAEAASVQALVIPIDSTARATNKHATSSAAMYLSPTHADRERQDRGRYDAFSSPLLANEQTDGMMSMPSSFRDERSMLSGESAFDMSIGGGGGNGGSSGSGLISSGSFWQSSASSNHLMTASLQTSDDDDSSSHSFDVFSASSSTSTAGRNIFSYWSSSLGRMSGYVAMSTGALTLLMGLYNSYFGKEYTWVGIYSMIAGGLTILYEVFSGRRTRRPLKLPVRAVAYIILLIPMLIAYPTRVAGILYGIVAAINLVAALRGESVTTKAKRKENEASLMPTTSSRGTSGNSNSSSSSATGQHASSSANKGQQSSSSSSSSSIPTNPFFTYFLAPSLYRSRRWLTLFLIVLINTICIGLFGKMNSEVGEWNVWRNTGIVTAWLLLVNMILFFFSSMKTSKKVLENTAEDGRIGQSDQKKRGVSFSSRLSIFLLSFFPSDPHNALMFYHRFFTYVIGIYSLLHGLAHTLSFMVQPDETANNYSYWIYTSGALIFILFIIIMSVSQDDIRLASSYLFKWIHMLYVPLFVLLILHAPRGFSALAAVSLVLPMLIALLDNVYNYYYGRRIDIPILSISFIRPNTVRIECNLYYANANNIDRFTEGSYVYINFPALNSTTWIPVTISSAPQSGDSTTAASSSATGMAGIEGGIISNSNSVNNGTTFTFHLLLDATSSSSVRATTRFYEYFQSLGPLGSDHFVLNESEHINNGENRAHRAAIRRATQRQGRIYDNEGKKLIRIDGPHRSVVSHVVQYHTTLLVAPSAGVNSISSAMRSILQHRWRQSLAVAGGLGDSRSNLNAISSSSVSPASSTTPDVFFVCWLVKWHEIDDYRWMMQMIKDCEDDLFLLRDATASTSSSSSSSSSQPHRSSSDAYLRSKHFEMHIYVTNVPSSITNGNALTTHLPSNIQDESFFGPSLTVSPATHAHLKSPVSCIDLYKAMRYPTSPVQQFSNIHIHRGEPQWSNDIFQPIIHRTSGQSEIACIYTAGALGMNITAASAAALRENGINANLVPSVHQIEMNERYSTQLRRNCEHHTQQSGKMWNYLTDCEME